MRKKTNKKSGQGDRKRDLQKEPESPPITTTPGSDTLSGAQSSALPEGPSAPDVGRSKPAISTQRPASVSTYEVAGTVFPMVLQKRCKTCTSPRRYDLEMAIVYGGGFSEVAGMFPHSGVSAKNLRDHINSKHLDLEDATVRRLRAEHAEKVRRADLESLGGRLYEHLSGVPSRTLDGFVHLLWELSRLSEDGALLEKGFRYPMESFGGDR